MYRPIRTMRATYRVAGGKTDAADAPSAWEWFLRITHLVLLAGVTAVTVTALVLVASQTGATKASFLTSTFLSTYYTDNHTLAWAPPTNPADPTRLVDTFYSCLNAASVGFDASVGCSQGDVPTYQACLVNTTGSQTYRTAREKAYWKRVVALIASENINYANALTLQNMDVAGLVSTAQASYLADKAQGSNSSNIGRIITQFRDQGLLSSDAMLRITVQATRLQGIAGCIANADLTAGVLHPIQSVYDQLWECTTDVVDTDAGQGRLFKKCTTLSPWPVLDEMQTPYSTQFLGSYNRLFVLLIAAWILNSFLVYTTWVVPWEGYPQYSELGKVKTLWGATGPILTGVCALWNAGGMFFLIPSTQTDGPISMTIQSTYLAGVFLYVVTGYFLWNLFERAYPMAEARAPEEAVRTGADARKYSVTPLKGYARTVQGAGETRSDPTPIMTQAWSDAAVPTEALLVLAVIGITKDVVTADAGRIFLSTLIGAVLQSALVRALYEGYMYKTDDRGTPIHRLAAFTVMASVWNGFAVWILVYKRYAPDGSFAHSVIISYVVFTSILPVVAWMVYFLCLDLARPISGFGWEVDFKDSLYNVTRFSFYFAVLVRIVFVALVLGYTGKEDNQGLSNLLFQLTIQ